MSANGEKTTRRERVERGIYRNPKTGAYEITFTNSDGKRRWTTIDGNLKAARAARAEVVAKLGKGERVPTNRDSYAFRDQQGEPIACRGQRLRRGVA
jgi:hypothetical protein